MRRAVTISNAKHEAGHWITGWFHNEASNDVVISTTMEGNSYCEKEPHPDFTDISAINDHLKNRIINLLAGAKAESIVCGSINNEMYRQLINDYEGAWPDYFIASELFRYYFRSLPKNTRMTFEEEWRAVEARCEEMVIMHESFILRVADEAAIRFSEEHREIKLTKDEMIQILNSHS